MPFFEKSLQSFEKFIEKLVTFTLLSIVRCENKNLAALVVSVPEIAKGSIKKSNRLYLFKNLFHLHCSRG